MFNQTLLAKLAWRIITAPGCLLARVLLGKYFHNRNFLEVTAPEACFHGWRNILHGRDLLKEHIGKAIGNGNSTNIWKDSLISLDRNIKPFGSIPEAAMDLTVAYLLTTDLKWNTARIKEVLPGLEAEIKRLQPSVRGREDSYMWQPTKSGIYSRKSGYHSAALDKANTSQHQTPNDFDWIKDLWSASFSPMQKCLCGQLCRMHFPWGRICKNKEWAQRFYVLDAKHKHL